MPAKRYALAGSWIWSREEEALAFLEVCGCLCNGQALYARSRGAASEASADQTDPGDCIASAYRHSCLPDHRYLCHRGKTHRKSFLTTHRQSLRLPNLSRTPGVRRDYGVGCPEASRGRLHRFLAKEGRVRTQVSENRPEFYLRSCILGILDLENSRPMVHRRSLHNWPLDSSKLRSAAHLTC